MSKTVTEERRRIRPLPWILAALILIAAFATRAYLISTKPETPKAEVKKPITVVSTETIKLQSLPPVLKLYGTVESRSATLLSSRTNASVESLKVGEGDAVKQGQLLVELEQTDTRFAADQARARVTEAQANLEAEVSRHETDKASLRNEQALVEIASKDLQRFIDLQKEGLASQSEVDTARVALEQRLLAVSARQLAVEQHGGRKAQIEAQLASARAGLNDVKLDINRSRITAPFDGLIYRTEVAAGDVVNPSTPLIGIYDPKQLEIRTAIPTRSLAAIQASLQTGNAPSAEIQVGGGLVSGHLDRLSASTRPGTGNLDAFIVADQPSPLLRLGQTVTILLRLDLAENVAAVPFSALYGSNRVYLLIDEAMQGIAIDRVGEYLTEDGKTLVLIRSPELKGGEQLITSQVARALDGLAVSTAASTEESQ